MATGDTIQHGNLKAREATHKNGWVTPGRLGKGLCGGIEIVVLLPAVFDRIAEDLAILSRSESASS